MQKFMILAASAILFNGAAQAQTVIPSDAVPTCALTAEEFAKWGIDGVFKPANSTIFDDSTDCNFYKWGAQMFLWITSEVSGDLVYNGPDFYQVVKDGDFMNFVPSGESSGTGLPVRTEKGDDETAVAQTGGAGVLISTVGSPVDSIVYYGIKANNVYAYYRSGQFAIAFDNTLQNNFPTDADDLAAIEQYVSNNFDQDSISNGDALTLELKSSWVIADTLGALDDVKKRYITTEATISTFDDSNPTSWPNTGTTTETMAMVGLHVVGSVKGHPELVWATFEHIDNAPQNNYVYLAKTGLREVGYDGVFGTSWTFNADPVVAAADLPVTAVNERSELDDNVITALPDQTIGADKVVRLNPWGDAPQSIQAGLVADYGKGVSTPISRTTDLVSLASTLNDLLGSSDVRSNYIQTGSIWSKGTDNIPTSGNDPSLRGNLQLANATMETYHQFPDSHSTGSFRPKNCFGCHSISSPTGPSLGVSHIFGDLLPLKPPPSE